MICSAMGDAPAWRRWARIGPLFTTVCIPINVGCTGSSTVDVVKLQPQRNTCEVIIAGPAAAGDMRLWVPEAILSDRGASAAYPIGRLWERHGNTFTHEVVEAGLFGPGNVKRIAPDMLECVGIAFPLDPPVNWRTTVTAQPDGVTFCIELTNVGEATLVKAGAAICLKFLQAAWWSDDDTFVLSDRRVQSLSALGREAGPPNGFEAYLMAGQSFDNVFYHEFWGFNAHRLDRPMMVSRHRQAGLCVGIEADHAYFLHSNRGNPCTDVMLAFGDVRPGQTATACGRVWIRPGRASEHLAIATADLE
jgi:hypothetical protein